MPAASSTAGCSRRCAPWGSRSTPCCAWPMRYQTMIPASFTTLWEHYDRWWATRIDAFDDGSSLNHGWNPPVMNLSQTIAGVAPDAPGWSTYHDPAQRSVSHIAQGRRPFHQGTGRRDDQEDRASVCPGRDRAADTAVVGIPKGSFSKLARISVNGETIWDGAFHGGPRAFPGTERTRTTSSSTPARGRGLQRVRIAPACQAEATAGPTVRRWPLDSKAWTASASVADGTFTFTDAKIPIDVSAANAIDGDHWTGWRDLAEPSTRAVVSDRHATSADVPQARARHHLGPVGLSERVCRRDLRDGEHWGEPIAVGRASRASRRSPAGEGRGALDPDHPDRREPDLPLVDLRAAPSPAVRGDDRYRAFR